jgi:hypothetical protein
VDSRRQTIWQAGRLAGWQKKERPVVSRKRDTATAADYNRTLWANAN